MPTKTETRDPQIGPEMLGNIQTKALEAFAALAQTNQRILQGFADLGVASTKEGLRAYAELQSAAVEAVRSTQSAVTPPSAEEFKSDPFSLYQKGLLGTVDGSQKWLRLFETNAQIATGSAERLHASAERTGKEIQDALTSYMTRMKEIYARD